MPVIDVLRYLWNWARDKSEFMIYYILTALSYRIIMTLETVEEKFSFHSLMLVW